MRIAPNIYGSFNPLPNIANSRAQIAAPIAAPDPQDDAFAATGFGLTALFVGELG
jgi:hypothetical protein